MKPSRPTLLLAFLATACSPGSDVEHQGSYAFLPSPGINDTPPRPLSHLLIVEQDAISEQTLFYYFTGDLGAAGLGFEDLGRLALRHNRFQMRFTVPLANYAEAIRRADTLALSAGGASTNDSSADAAGAGETAGAGGAGGAAGASNSAQFVPASDEPLQAIIDGRPVLLWQLDSAGLPIVGASRYLATLDSTDFAVDAFAGILNNAHSLLEMQIETGETTLRHTSELSSADLVVSRDDNLLVVESGELSNVDYLSIDLLQSITRISDQAKIEASVHISLSPDVTYAASNALLTDAFGQGCWSTEQPLWLRFTQVARSYQRLEGGDFAVIQREQAFSEVDEDLWVDAIEAPQSAGYCDLYE